MDLPPPPAGSPELLVPPPPGTSDIPPPTAEVHENDVLKRRKHFSWRAFGGDGFLVSVAFHVLLLLLGLFYVIQKYTEPKKPDTEVFATGAGGGANGDKAKQFEHKMQRKLPTPVKSPSRIVSKAANAAVSLPSTPSTSTASFASGLAAGGMSKGSGGGSGGGEGTGIGIGKGGGRNFVSLFGAIGVNAPGLPGTFYDIKQDKNGNATKYADSGSVQEFTMEVLRPFVKSWSESRLDKYFKAPDQLAASQIFIPYGTAEAAPKAYGVENKVRGQRWLAWYRGAVTAPKSGKFRFWGLADDALVVRWRGANVLDAGWAILTTGIGPSSNSALHVGKPVLGVTESRAGSHGVHFRAGKWIEVTSGQSYPIEILISEIPGGYFGAWLLMEEAGSDGRGDGRLFLFRMSDDPLPEGLQNDTGLSVDLTGKGLIWKAKGQRSSIR